LLLHVVDVSHRRPPTIEAVNAVLEEIARRETDAHVF